MYDLTTGNSISIINAGSGVRSLSQYDLLNLQQGNRLNMAAQFNNFRLENTVYRMEWTGFNLADISINQPVAFKVMHYKKIVEYSRMSTVFKFNLVLINMGSCWDNATGMFTALVDGIYIFSFSVTTKAITDNVKMAIIPKNHDASMSCISSQTICMLKFSQLGTNEDQVITVSSSVVLKLNKNVSTFICSDLYNTNEYDQALFRGFLYSPPNSKFFVWSVLATNITELIKPSGIFSKIIVAFNKIVINTGNVIKCNDSCSVIIPTDGIYYVTVNTPPIRYAHVVLIVGPSEQREFTIAEDGQIMNCIQYEYSLVLKLAAFDNLSLRVGGYAFDNTIEEHNGLRFAGFLIALI